MGRILCNWQGDVETIKALLAAGADPNALHQGEAPLHLASLGAHVDAIKILLEAGADPNGRSNEADTPLHYAARATNIAKALKAALLAKFETDDEAKIPAVLPKTRGHVEAIEALLAAGVDPNARNNKAETPLHYAAIVGHVEAIEALLAAGADPNVQDDEGRTPRDVAQENGSTDAVTLLDSL